MLGKEHSSKRSEVMSAHRSKESVKSECMTRAGSAQVGVLILKRIGQEKLNARRQLRDCTGIKQRASNKKNKQDNGRNYFTPLD